MTDELRKRLKQSKPFDGSHQEAMISLMVAAASVRGELEQVCCKHGIFGSQYNILRILAGGPPEGYPRGEIINRMIDRCPDVTRLVDPLEKKGLVSRERSQEDRRVVLHRITKKGQDVLNALSPDLEYIQEAFREELSEKELGELSQCCSAIYNRFDEMCV